jgi:hypothetical protein
MPRAPRSLAVPSGPASLPRTLLLAAVLATPAPAQTVSETLEITRQAIESQRRVLVSGALPLTEEESEAFWPLYDDYEKRRRAIEERSNKLVADFLASLGSLGDAQARAMLKEALAVDEARLELRRSYSERMAKAIPPRKVVRFFQIDNKLDSVVRADISRRIPLVP